MLRPLRTQRSCSESSSGGLFADMDVTSCDQLLPSDTNPGDIHVYKYIYIYSGFPMHNSIVLGDPSNRNKWRN